MRTGMLSPFKVISNCCCRGGPSSALLVFNYDEFRARADVDIDILRVYTDMVQWTLVFAIKRIEDFTQKSPEQRYLRLLEQHGDLVNRAPLKHLASYLGITTFSLSRIRKRWPKTEIDFSQAF